MLRGDRRTTTLRSLHYGADEAAVKKCPRGPPLKLVVDTDVVAAASSREFHR
jgi:hypothetical protein